MQNLVQPGRTITVTAPANVESGEGVLIGQLFGVAAGDADNGASLDLVTEGVFSLPKESADVFASVGLPVYWEPTAKLVRSHSDTDSNSSGDTAALVGVTVEAAGTGVTTVKVKLAPSPVTLV